MKGTARIKPRDRSVRAFELRGPRGSARWKHPLTYEEVIHPSAVLRICDDASRHAAFASLVEDLREARQLVEDLVAG